MSKFNRVQTNFRTGEISEKVINNLDSKEYSGACHKVENFIPLKSGGMAKRPGTQFAFTIPKSGTNLVAFPFTSSRDVKYIITFESTNLLFIGGIRIHKAIGHSQVFTTPYNLPTVTSGLFQYVAIGDSMIFTSSEGNVAPFVIQLTDQDTDTFLVSLFDSAFNSSEIPSLSSFFRTPYLDRNVLGLTLQPSGTALGSTITLNASGPLFPVNIEGTRFRLIQGVHEGVVRVVTRISDIEATAIVEFPLLDTSVTTNWAESSWSRLRGYPKTICFFEQRLFFGGTDYEPSKFWGSRIGNAVHFMQERLIQDILSDSAAPGTIPADASGNGFFGKTKETDPFGYSISSTKTNAIRWINSRDVLTIGTDTGEYIATGNGSVLGLLSVSIIKQTSYGSRAFRTETVGDEILFVSKDGRRFRSFVFSRNNGSHISLDLNLLSDHMYRGNSDIVTDSFESAYYSPHRDCVWIVTKLGSLIGLTYSKENSLLSWHRHLISDDLGNEVNIKSAMVLDHDNYDRLYLTTERDGKWAIEYVSDDPEYKSIHVDFPSTFLNPVTFLDASLSFTMIGQTITTTLSYFFNKNVSVTKNGIYIGEFLVSAGGELDVGLVHTGIVDDIFIMGFKYTSILETVDIEAGGDFGFAKGMKQRIDRVTALIYKTFDLSIGVDKGYIDPVKLEGDLTSGDVVIMLPQTPSSKIKVKMQSTKPYPCTILGLAMRGVSYD